MRSFVQKKMLIVFCRVVVSNVSWRNMVWVEMGLTVPVVSILEIALPRAELFARV